MCQYLKFLKQTDIFYQFTEHQLEIIAGLCHEQILETGEIIFWEGSNSDELYIIVHGVVDILVNPSLVSDMPDKEYDPVTIATLRRGQSFGEIALVDQGLRSATARIAQDHTRLLIVPSEKLLETCKSHPDLGFQLMFNLAADLALKIRSTSLRVREEMIYSSIQK